MPPTQKPTTIPTTASPTTRAPTYFADKPTPLPSTSFPTGRPTSVPTSSPTFSPAPLIVKMTSKAQSKDSIAVSVWLQGGKGIVYCAAINSNLPSPAVLDIVRQKNSAISENSVASLVLSGLSAMTKYNLYCVTQSNHGVYSRQSDIAHTSDTTLCCKSVLVNIGVSNAFEGTTTLTAATVQIDTAPSIALQINLGVQGTLGSSGGSTLSPNTISATNKMTSMWTTNIVFIAGIADVYNITVTLTGPSSSEYNVIYVRGDNNIGVISQDTEPVTPKLASAQFSADGSAVVVSFDAPTDKGGYTNSFPCTNLLAFPGAASSMCTWQYDASQIMVYAGPAATSLLVIGSTVSVVSGTIKAKCTALSAITCKKWAYITTNNSPAVVLTRPASPIPPVITIVAPNVVGGCNSFTLDLSSSTGAGGRPWQQPRFVIDSNTVNASLLQDFFNNTYQMSPPTAVPYNLLVKGGSYGITVTLCNFLGACSVATHSLSVSLSMEPLPVVSILGQQYINIARNQGLSISAIAYTAECSGSLSFANIAFVWRVFASDTGLEVTSLTTESRDPSRFKLSAYRLSKNTQYTIKVQATQTLSGKSSSTSVNVFVTSSDLVAVIKGGRQMSARQGEAFTLDATSSYDQDVQDATGVDSDGKKLVYAWTCVQIQPSYSTSCPLSLPPNFSSLGQFAASGISDSSVLTVSRFTLTVSDVQQTRSSVTYTDVTILRASAPVVSITSSTQSLQNVNVLSTVVLTGSVQLVASTCNAIWSVNDNSISLRDASLVPIATSLTSPSQTSLNLVLGPNSLPERATLVFSLTCASSTASVTITTNGPPLPGKFDISPTRGTELTTKFSFSTSQWTDPDLPISFQFGFVSSSKTMIIQSRSESSFGASILPAGSLSSNFTLKGTAQVFDTLGANVFAFSSIIVNLASSTFDTTKTILSSLSASTGSIDNTKQVLSTAGSVMNRVDCSGAPICAKLNRTACDKTSQTCGPCLPNFIGDLGDANTACLDPISFAAHVRASSLMSKDCAVPSCSGHGKCVFVNSDTGNIISNCPLTSTTCDAICMCNFNYTGSACDITIAAALSRQKTRELLINSLTSIVTGEDATAEAVDSWATSLSTLTQIPSDLTSHSVDVTMNVAQSIVGSASASSPTTIANIMSALDATSTSAVSSSLDISASHGAKTLNILSQMDSLISVYPGQNSVTSVLKDFRMATQAHSLESTSTSAGGGIDASPSRMQRLFLVNKYLQ